MSLIPDIYYDIAQYVYSCCTVDNRFDKSEDTSVAEYNYLELMGKFILSGKQHLIAVKKATNKAKSISFMKSRSSDVNLHHSSYFYMVNFRWVRIGVLVLLIIRYHRTGI